MTPEEFIAYCGNITQAAAKAQVTEMSIRNWKAEKKIPCIQQRSIQVLTKGELKADKECK